MPDHTNGERNTAGFEIASSWHKDAEASYKVRKVCLNLLSSRSIHMHSNAAYGYKISGTVCLPAVSKEVAYFNLPLFQ